MNLELNIKLADSYSSNSQIARVLTENWVRTNSYCPSCGDFKLEEYPNNRPVADFYCKQCKSEYELKSKNSDSIGKKIADGAYSTMIERINSSNNPSFFFLTYNNVKWEVTNFLIIPKHYFISEMIEERKPLPPTARRSGWIGCNIDLTKIPSNGRIYLIENSTILPKENVQAKWKSTEFLKNKKGISRGWVLDVMNCIDAIKKDIFLLKDIYQFEEVLKIKYPGNNFIKDKIRQQLQILRDKNVIEFKENGKYKKLWK